MRAIENVLVNSQLSTVLRERVSKVSTNNQHSIVEHRLVGGG